LQLAAQRGIVAAVGNVTHILAAVEQGNHAAAEELLPLVYEELRKLAEAKLAQEKPGQTLQATALVHEAYIRLVGAEPTQRWDSRGHFFAASAEAMRRILIDRARNKKRLKRGGELAKLDLDALECALDSPPDELLAIDEALESLAVDHKDCAQLVKLRFFAGMSQREAAAALALPRRTADRQWSFARAWLFKRLSERDDAARA
jgi:RNA polymerase sigma factor (TIGR02999 family)